RLARAQERLDELSRELEIQIEECNTRREELKAAKRAVKENRSSYDRAQQDMAAVEAERGSVVAELYKQRTSGSQVETFASPARSLSEYAERLTLLDITAAARTSAVEHYVALREQLAASGELLDETVDRAERANTEAQRTCDRTKRKVEAEEERVAELAAQVERLERRNRQRAAASESGGGDAATGSVPKVSGNAAGAVEFALAQVGKPYQWGG